MSYLAIYRKFRPKTFDELIGQEHIVKTLTNQITTGRIGHAYLFCGSRGTGKTTTAKIFAKAINCETPINGSPCGVCPTCKALAEQNNLDILEIDAASNNRVDNVRELRDKVQYPPVAGRYKVYIIDEVHMLSTEAFNALLKTLEEPPKHAVFILATTEQHKLPATILSRCMRFDFKLVSDKEIASLIKRIYTEVGVSYEDDAVMKIARSGEGSVRDALSVADLCVSIGSEKLTYSGVIEVLGASDNEKTYQLAKAVLAGNMTAAVTAAEEVAASGKSVALCSHDVAEIFKNLLIVKTCSSGGDVLGLPASEYESLRALSDLADERGILRVLEIFADLESDLKYSTHQKVLFITAVLKAALPKEDYSMDSLIERVSKLEKQILSLTEKLEKGVTVAPLAAPSQTPAQDSVPPEMVTAATPAPAPAPALAPAPAPSKRKIAEEEAQAPAFDELPPLDALTPPEEDDQPSFFGAPAFETSQKRPQAEDAPQAPAQTSSIEVNPTRLWGTVIRRLRADKNIMLWIACQDASTRIVGDKLEVTLDGNNEYNLLTKADNVATIQKIVDESAKLKVVFAKRGEREIDEFESDIETAKSILGNVTVED